MKEKITGISLAVLLAFVFHSTLKFEVDSNSSSVMAVNKDIKEKDSSKAVPKTTLDVILENSKKIVDSCPESFGIYHVSLFSDNEDLIRGYAISVANSKTTFFDLNHNRLASFDDIEGSCLSDWIPEKFKNYDQLTYGFMFGKLWAKEHKNVKTGWSQHILFKDGEISHLWEENPNEPDLRYHLDPKTKNLVKFSRTDPSTGKRAFYDLEENFIELCVKDEREL